MSTATRQHDAAAAGGRAAVLMTEAASRTLVQRSAPSTRVRSMRAKGCRTATERAGPELAAARLREQLLVPRASCSASLRARVSIRQRGRRLTTKRSGGDPLAPTEEREDQAATAETATVTSSGPMLSSSWPAQGHDARFAPRCLGRSLGGADVTATRPPRSHQSATMGPR